MKVVFPIFSIDVCGGHRVFADVANGLVSHGHEVEVVMPYLGAIAYPLLCRVRRVPELSREVIPFGDVVLSNYFTTCRMCYEAWPPHVVNLSQGFEPLYVDDPRVDDQYRYATPIISTSTWLDSQIFKLTGRHTSIVNPGVDLSVFCKRPVRTFDSSSTRVAYVARDPSVAAYKGFSDFVEAIRHVTRQSGDRIEVLFASPDKAIDYPPDIPHKSFSPSSQADMAVFYNQADLFVSTAWHEGFSLPPLEAMACGVPVITTDSGGIRDYCVPGYNSLITPARDPAAMAQAILVVMENTELAARLGRHGMETAKRFSVAEFQERFSRTLEGIASRRGARSFLPNPNTV